ncbi:hypothetical protein Tco_1369126 [Tanacetum coccineum]
MKSTREGHHQLKVPSLWYNDEDGDNDANDRDGDEREIKSGTKKYRGSNSSDGGNTGDGVKIAGGVIGSGDGIEFSEELKELLLMKLGNNPRDEVELQNIP